MTETHQWMTHPSTGGTNRFPIEAVDDWAARGWEPCDPPPEPDPTNTVLVDGVDTEPEPDVVPPPEAQSPGDEATPPPERTEPATDATDEE